MLCRIVCFLFGHTLDDDFRPTTWRDAQRVASGQPPLEKVERFCFTCQRHVRVRP